MVGKQPAQVIRRQSRPCMSEQISEVVGYVYRAQPAALGQGVHEGMFPCRFLTPYVQAIPKRELYGLDPLFGQVVGYLRDTGLQDIGQVVPLIAEEPTAFLNSPTAIIAFLLLESPFRLRHGKRPIKRPVRIARRFMGCLLYEKAYFRKYAFRGFCRWVYDLTTLPLTVNTTRGLLALLFTLSDLRKKPRGRPRVLNLTLIVPYSPGAMGFIGKDGTVHPHSVKTL